MMVVGVQNGNIDQKWVKVASWPGGGPVTLPEVKKVLLKILQISQENPCVGVSF